MARFRGEPRVRSGFRDGRSGYVFSTNPSGARYDALVTNRGEGENSSWDEIWEAAAQIDAHGWSVEIRIPVRSLRFDASLTAWGFHVERRVERLQEVSRWSGTTRDYKVTQTSRSGLITGLPRLDPGIGLSVTPSVVGSAGYTELGGASELNQDPSLDVTQLLGPSLLGSLTANTDFAETEVDTLRTNLTWLAPRPAALLFTAHRPGAEHEHRRHTAATERAGGVLGGDHRDGR